MFAQLVYGLGANIVVLRLKANRACIVHVGSENGQTKYTVMKAPRRYSFLRFSLPDENSTEWSEVVGTLCSGSV